MVQDKTEPVMTAQKLPRWYIHIADFANMLKAFIGSNYLSVSFAFLQSGLGLGIVGLLFIASLTDHCCHLIVKTKYHAIRKVTQLQTSNSNHADSEKPKNTSNKDSKYAATFHSRKYSLLSSDEESDKCSLVDKESNSSDDEDEYVIYDIDEVSIMEQHMMKHMSYGDIGRMSFGRAGTFIVNLCIVLTQFGFCVAYFIFIGNTIYSMFPYHVCVNPLLNSTSVNTSESNTTLVPLCKDYYMDLVPSSKQENSSKTFYRIKRLDNVTENVNNDTFVTTSMIPKYSTYNENTTYPTTSGTSFANFSTDSPYNSTTQRPEVSSNTATTTGIISSMPTQTSVESTTPAQNRIDWDDLSTKVLQKAAPSLKLLVASPLPLFILFAFIRTVRKLGFISVIANTAILIGCISVFFYVIVDFKFSEDVVWVNWSGLPVFFGMVTAAFEGIGLVIPVESSMEGNRHNFNKFLHGAILVLSLVLGGFGTLGYMRFGDNLHQMLNTNIPPSSWMSFSVNICVIIGVVFTFPLQIYPVIELLEIALFSEGSLFGPKKESKLVLDDNVEDIQSDKEALIPKTPPQPIEMPVSVAVHIPESVPTWKRNILRIIIVFCAAGLAIIFRDSFAFVGAFTGAIGSSLLAYILPCLFHLKLCREELPYLIIIKDVVIIVVGVCCSVISLYSVILNLIENTGL